MMAAGIHAVGIRRGSARATDIPAGMSSAGPQRFASLLANKGERNSTITTAATTVAVALIVAITITIHLLGLFAGDGSRCRMASAGLFYILSTFSAGTTMAELQTVVGSAFQSLST